MRALVVVDYQNDFVDGSLGSQDAVIIGDAVCDRISDHLASGDESSGMRSATAYPII